MLSDQIQHLLAHVLQLEAEVHEDLRRNPLLFAPQAEEQVTEVRGRHLATGLPTAVQLRSEKRGTFPVAQNSAQRECPPLATVRRHSAWRSWQASVDWRLSRLPFAQICANGGLPK